MMDNELFKQTQIAREQWAMKHYKKHETELGLNELKELDQAYPGWGLATTKKGDVLEVSMGGTRVRDAITKSEKTIYCARKNGKIGYSFIYINYKNNSKWYYHQSVHRLVAMAFVDNPENKPEVNHINGIKTNNAYWNLEWVTPSENHQHAVRTGLNVALKGESCPGSKCSNKQIEQVCQLLCERPDLTFKEIGNIVGVNTRTVGSVYRHETWKSISDKYDFINHKAIIVKGDRSHWAKYTNEQAEQVCQLLDNAYLNNTNIPYKDIAKLTNTNVKFVAHISQGDSWVDVAKKHPFYKAKFGDQVKQGPANNS